jgi:hypothetical protein
MDSPVDNSGLAPPSISARFRRGSIGKHDVSYMSASCAPEICVTPVRATRPASPQ